MDLSHPLRVVTPTLDGDILRALAQAETEFTPPEIHRVVGEHSVHGIRKGLERLVAQGVVLKRHAGRASLYQLNRSHLATPAIIELANMRPAFLALLREHIAGWSPPCEFAALFGSAARGTMESSSDIDVFVVCPDSVDEDDDAWDEQLVELGQGVRAWTGNVANLLVFSAHDVHEASAHQDPILDSIRNDGVVLFGDRNYLGHLRATGVN